MENKATVVQIDGQETVKTVRGRGGFLRLHEIEIIATDPITRLQMLLVRCGCGRFMAPAQDVIHFISIIERDSKANPQDELADYIRDVSLPAVAQ